MKRNILSRYAHTNAGEIIIDVAASRVQNLYNDFDKIAPYLKKNLDQDMVDYLVDCAREIGRSSFIIRITLSQKPDEEVVARVKKSIQNFFVYLKELEKRKMRQMIRTSLILFGIGLSILFLALWVNQMLSASAGVIFHVFAEGLTVAAWVSLWEALATFLIQWAPHRREIRLFERLSKAPVYLHTPDELSVKSELDSVN
jgi:hypothetical protein